MIKKIILSAVILFSMQTFAEEAAIAEPAVEPATVQATPEDQIPLKIDVTQASAGKTSQSGKLFLTLFILVGLFGSAYYFIRKYSFSNKINKSNMQIKMLAQHHLGPKKSLAIIRVAGESILIGVTDQNISMIKSLSLIDDEVPAEAPQNFAQVMGNESQPIEEMAQEIEDDFSFAGIKSNVSQKLKSMRNFQ